MSIEQDQAHTSTVNVGMTDRWSSWRRRLIAIGVLAAIWAFAGVFYKQTYVGVIDRDTYDIAQIARNIYDGRGFTTNFIRPFNAGLSETNYANVELNHAPLYPYAVSVFFAKGASDQTALWPGIIFFCLTVVAVYFLGSLLFDWRCGLLAAVLFGVSAPLLKIGVSGSLWTMAALFFTMLLYVVALHHRVSSDQPSTKGLVWAGISGILFALIYYTHNVTIFLIIPLAVYFAVTGSARKAHVITFLLVSIVLISPWVYRNYELTKSPLIGLSA